METGGTNLAALSAPEEQLLLAQLRAGSREAFRTLYQRLLGRVLALCRRLLGDEQAAQDATQEVFLRVFRSFHTFQGEARLATWVFRIATNVCLTELARRSRRPQDLPGQDGAPQDDLEAPQPSPETLVTTDQLLALVEGLSPDKRAAFHLAFVEGLSAAEVGQVLGESRETMLKRLQRLRIELAGRLCGGAAP